MKKLNIERMQNVNANGAGLCIIATVGVSIVATPVAGMYTGLACWLALEYKK